MFEKKGCMVVTYILGALVLIGIANTGTCTSFLPWMQPAVQDNSQSTVVAQIGGQPVTADQVETQALVAKQGQPQIEPGYDFFLTSDALDQTLSRAAIEVLAKEKGIKVNDDVAKGLFDEEFPKMITSEKQRLVTEKKLKEGASDKEFEAAFKKETGGKTVEEIKNDRLMTFLARLKDPNEGPRLATEISALLLSQSYEKNLNLGLEDLKKSYDTYNVLRMTFADPKQTLEQRTEAAKKAIAEVKGGMKFEDALAKYNKGAPTIPLPYTAALIEREASLKPVASLKPGELSEPLVQGQTVAVYKLISLKQSLPSDFEKTKDTLLKNFKQERAGAAMQEDIKAMKDTKLVWKDPAVELAFKVYKAQREGFSSSAPADLNAKLLDLSKEATTTKPSTAFGERLMGLARYSAYEAYYNTLAPDKKEAANEERVEILQSVLDHNESNAIRLQLYETFVAMKNYEDAGAMLLDVAKYNTGTDEASVRATSDLRLRTDKAEKDGKIDKATIAAIRKEITRWEQDRIEEEKVKKEAEKGVSGVDKELEKLNDPEAVKKSQEPKKDSGSKN